MDEGQFSYQRGRGLVWVCDIEGSTRFLNDDATADSIEEYFPRLHWIARQAIASFYGQFIKWTGDGFVAWFPFRLHRQLGEMASDVLELIWHLTVLNNVTQLQVRSPKTIKLRHGVTVEHDALMTHIAGSEGSTSDLIGRAVVLAFRLSGIKAAFPGIVAQGEVINAAKPYSHHSIHFKKRTISAEERLKYFKGEAWGTKDLVVSAERPPRRRSLSTVVKHAKGAIASATMTGNSDRERVARISRLLTALETGPQWAALSLKEYARFTREDLLGSLQAIVAEIERSGGDHAS